MKINYIIIKLIIKLSKLFIFNTVIMNHCACIIKAIYMLNFIMKNIEKFKNDILMHKLDFLFENS